MKFYRLLFVLIGLILYSTTLSGQIKLEGVVYNIDTYQPMDSVTVRIKDLTLQTQTDSLGVYKFSNLNAGTYTVTWEVKGFYTLEMLVKIKSDRMLKAYLIPIKNEEGKTNVSKLMEEVIIEATSPEENTPTTFTTIKKQEIEKQNLGQDIPYLLQMSPSIITTSDAGNGIGYTGIRIRGSDPTRVNVTINGIPLNDSESQGVFWVDLPDLGSSVEQIQVQRGVGTSTNGAAAFGGSLNIQTSELAAKPFGEIHNSIGSFGTGKHTLKLGTGLLHNRFAIEGRISKIYSDGYIDRARSDLESIYLAGAYYGKNSILKAVVLSGVETTYQAWNGVHEDSLATNPTFNSAGMYTDEQGQVQFHDNQVDQYQQDHYQLHYAHHFNPNFYFAGALHYTYGRGYYEQYKEDQQLLDYQISNVNLENDTITNTDLIRRRWLDNHFYGLTFAFHYEQLKWNFILGGAYNNYLGTHFGEIIWAKFASNGAIGHRFYDNESQKMDAHIYLKTNYELNNRFNLFLDMQLRQIDYETTGLDIDQRTIDTEQSFLFFNPKLGLNYKITDSQRLYGSYAIGQREPVRNDFIDAEQGQIPDSEFLQNIELGYHGQLTKWRYTINYYGMFYKNQLVLTGAINDVGAPIRQNVDQSYRQGIELSVNYQILPKLNWQANASISQNKIKKLTESVVNYDEGSVQTIEHANTDISFSPSVVAASTVSVTILKGLVADWQAKYMGLQYLDNTSSLERSIPAYFIHNLRVGYTLKPDFMEEINFKLLVNNLFDVRYEANGYTYSYIYGDELMTENYYYPQAGLQFMAGMGIIF